MYLRKEALEEMDAMYEHMGRCAKGLLKPSQYMGELSDLDSESSTPIHHLEHCIDEDSPEHVREYLRSHVDTKQFYRCTKLQSSRNYDKWHRDFKRRASRCSLGPLFSGVEKAPVRLEEPDEQESSEEVLEEEQEVSYEKADSILEYNQYMLDQARWEGRNKSLVGYLRSTLHWNLGRIIRDDCEFVLEAMKAIDDACPPLPVDTRPIPVGATPGQARRHRQRQRMAQRINEQRSARLIA